MQITRLVRARYPNDSWSSHLPAQRLAKAQAILKKRKQNQTDVDLMDCLTLDDKQIIVSATSELRSILNLPEPNGAATLFKRVIALRNDLAHAHDISTQWPQFLDDARILEAMIEAAEQVTSRQVRGLASPSLAV